MDAQNYKIFVSKIFYFRKSLKLYVNSEKKFILVYRRERIKSWISVYQVLEYLEEIVERFDLEKYIKFDTKEIY